MAKVPLFVNNYEPPQKSQLISKELSDLNFIDSIETARVKLVPFIPSIHADLFYQAAIQDPNLENYLPISLSTLEDVHEFCNTWMMNDPQNRLFAIIDKTRSAGNDRLASDDDDGALAGMVGVGRYSPKNLSVEIAPAIVLPTFQGTHVGKHAVGALLRYWLDVPSQGGMGIRRVVWMTHPENGRSVGFAEKVGFKKEGVLRWQRVLPKGRVGKKVPPERGSGSGWDTVLLSVCWDEWEGGVRDKVERLLGE